MTYYAVGRVYIRDCCVMFLSVFGGLSETLCRADGIPSVQRPNMVESDVHTHEYMHVFLIDPCSRPHLHLLRLAVLV